MTVEDEYRKHGDKCVFLAECSPKTADRAFWLLLAQNWQLLAQDSEEDWDLIYKKRRRTMNSKVPRSNTQVAPLGRAPLRLEIRHRLLACR
jgi:hypothetical protein